MNKTREMAYWINEREAMRVRREVTGVNVRVGDSGVPGWSMDPHMANVRYCNVRREDDKVTRWLAHNWRHVGPNATLAMVMARMVNWIPTLEQFPHPSEYADPLPWVKACWREMLTLEGQKWTNAYTISTCGKKMGKEDYVFGHVLPQVVKQCFDYRWQEGAQPWLADAHNALTQVDGLGSFLGAQVIADLKNTKGHPLWGALDWWEWSAPGPGSLRGLEAYYGQRVTPAGYQQAITQCYAEVAPLIAGVGRLHMQDFQNCLCEFSKYTRVLNGGHAKNGYRSV